MHHPEQRLTSLFSLFIPAFLASACALPATEPPSRDSQRAPEPEWTAGAELVQEELDENVPFGRPRSAEEVIVLESEGFTVGYSPEKKTPLWVGYRLFGEGEHEPGERPSRFLTDARVEEPVKHDDYTKTGYDRGHMAPNAPIARRYGEDAQQATFLTTNIAPQVPGLNQRGWEALESIVSERWAPAFEEVWVVVGPIFEGPCWQLRAGIRIPSHFFMVVVDVDEETGEVHALAVVMPQERVDAAPLAEFVTTVREIEARTGLDLLHALEDALEARVETSPPDARFEVDQEITPRFGGRARAIDRVSCAP